MAAAYIVFSYLRPQSIFPVLDILPWTQLSILAGLFYAVMKRNLTIQLPHLAVFGFCLACLLSAYYSQYPDISFSKLDLVFIWLVELVFFTSCVNSINKLRLIVILFFLVLFKISFFGARTWAQRGFGFADYGISGPSGYFENSGELSLLMAMLGMMSMALLFQNSNMRKLYWALPITAFMTVIAASSRGSQLALLIGVMIFFAVKGKFSFKSISLTLVICCAGYMLLPAEQKARFTSAGEDSTSQARLIYWEKGFDMALDHPLLGVGYKCFPKYFHDHYSHQMPVEGNWGQRREVSHNSFIEVSSQMGFVGLGFYLWMCMIVFKINKKTRRLLRKHSAEKKLNWLYQFSIGLDVAQVVFLIGSFFMSVALYPYIFFMLMFSQSMYNAINHEFDGKKSRRELETLSQQS